MNIAEIGFIFGHYVYFFGLITWCLISMYMSHFTLYFLHHDILPFPLCKLGKKILSNWHRQTFFENSNTSLDGITYVQNCKLKTKMYSTVCSLIKCQLKTEFCLRQFDEISNGSLESWTRMRKLKHAQNHIWKKILRVHNSHEKWRFGDLL